MFQVTARTSELLENSNEQRRKQEKALEEKQEQINKVEANMKSVTGDVIKVIRKSVGTPLWSNGDRYLLDPPYWPKRLSQICGRQALFSCRPIKVLHNKLCLFVEVNSQLIKTTLIFPVGEFHLKTCLSTIFIFLRTLSRMLTIRLCVMHGIFYLHCKVYSS